MDDSAQPITYDGDGVCNYCHEHDAIASKKRVGISDLFDSVDGRCLMGLSGGVDSSFVYTLAKRRGLNVVPIHYDNGWDTLEAKHNVRCLTEDRGVKLLNVVMDLDAVQARFFKAGVPDIEVPTDHAILATQYAIAKSYGIRNMLSGVNYATESHACPAWTHGHRDWRYILTVGRDPAMFHTSIWGDVRQTLSYRTIKPLNHIDYDREEAKRILHQDYGWVDYGGKHMESRITRFVHGYILPRRFGWDTRRSRLSAMICSGNMTRDEALKALESPSYPEDEMEADKAEVLKRWELSESEFSSYMAAPIKTFHDYPSYASNLTYLPLRAILKALRGGPYD